MPCSAPALCVGNNSDNKQDRQFIVVVFTTFSHSTLYTVQYVPWGTLFSVLSPPSPYPCVLGLGVGVMGNVVYVAILPTVYGYQVCFLYDLVHLKGFVK